MIDRIRRKLFGKWTVSASKTRREYLVTFTSSAGYDFITITFEEYNRLKDLLVKQKEKGDNLIVTEDINGNVMWFNRDKITSIKFKRNKDEFCESNILTELEADDIMEGLKRKQWHSIRKFKN